MSYSYTVCILPNIPSEKELENIIKNLLTEGDEEALKKQYLCLIRTICVEFLGDKIGSPTELIKQTIDHPALNQLPKKLARTISSNLSSSLLLLEDLEDESFDIYTLDSPGSLLMNFFKTILSSISLLKNSAGTKKITTRTVEVIQQQAPETKIEIQIDRLPNSIYALLETETDEGFFQAIQEGIRFFAREVVIDQSANEGFWRGNAFPEDENTCTSKLIGYLKMFFANLGIKIKSEYYIGNDRCDLCFSFKNWLIPLEAKVQNNREVWTGIKQQLVAKYIMQNKTCDYGLFLVYWFGVIGNGRNLASPPRDSTHNLPTSNEMLEQVLTEYYIPEEYKKNIEVVCLNCAVAAQ